MRRTGTGESSAQARNLRRRATDPFKTQQMKKETEQIVFQGRYGVYNKLTWEKLKGFLEGKFPDSTFDRLQVCSHRPIGAP